MMKVQGVKIFIFETLDFLGHPRGGAIIIHCRKIAISPEPNLRWTLDQSVNSSLSVVVQQKKTRALYLSRFSRGSPTKFENAIFQIAKLRFSRISVKIPDFSKNSLGKSLKARDLISQILTIYIHILTPVKTEFEKSLRIVDFRGPDDCPPQDKLF